MQKTVHGTLRANNRSNLAKENKEGLPSHELKDEEGINSGGYFQTEESNLCEDLGAEGNKQECRTKRPVFLEQR